MALLPEKAEEEVEMKEKKCEHFYVYYSDATDVFHNSRGNLVCKGKRPRPDHYVAYRLPYCPACGAKHTDHKDRKEE